MLITFITTVFNEQNNIEKYINSILNQTQLPDEIIIVDGMSTDETVERITKDELRIKEEGIKFKLIIKKGNRAVGRNEAIRQASGDIIVCSDAGNILDKKWVEEIIKPFVEEKTSSQPTPKRRGSWRSEVDVVAGYYEGKADNVFQKCLIPYALVMRDKVDPDNFLPATRSVAFTKKIWEKAGGFDEQLSHNEDYIFARKLKEIGAKIVFAKNAKVYWIPRKTFKEAFIMFFRFALGDAEANIFRPKVLFLFLRYLLFILLYGIYTYTKLPLILNSLFLILLLYIFWSINKNYKYVGERQAFIILPLMQFTADVAVLTGTCFGLLKSLLIKIKSNKILTLILTIYAFLVSITLSFGIPSPDHPFTYHMDEWHQLEAIKSIIKHGTTTISGSAEIPFLYPVLSGIYLTPFILLRIIDPLTLKSSVDNLILQQQLFIVLRSINIWFGIGSILLIANISKKYLKINYLIPIIFFVISPILIMLSGYFKYDVGLLFFILLSINYIYKFGDDPTLKNYILASIACSLALSVKFSAIPLLPLLIFAYFLYITNRIKQFNFVYFGVSSYIITFLLIGSPNILYGKADYSGLLYSNIIGRPQEVMNMLLPSTWWYFLSIIEFPYLFGHSAYFLSIAAIIYLIVYLIYKSNWNLKYNKNLLFFITSTLIFAFSLIPLKMGATGNRVLVLLPYLAIAAGILFSHIYKKAKGIIKYFFIFILIIIIVIQSLESIAWVYIKLIHDPQEVSSHWIQRNISKGSEFGIENMPIYQNLPNFIEKDFYSLQYNKKYNNYYVYKIINCSSNKLPKFLIITNGEIEKKLFAESEKKCLMNRIVKEKYKQLAIFTPDLNFLNIFTSDTVYYFSGIIPSPLTITIYYKM